ncbi:MAG TPA: AAA family ATPase, partial [Acidobacteriota bacterium]|nr:AAA family ATPase [Acidobacteriota bacterium]
VSEATGDGQRIPSFLEYVRSAPGAIYEPVPDPAGRIRLATHDRSVDMFPLAAICDGVPVWLLRCRTAVLVYADASGNLSQVDAAAPGFEEAIDALLDRGWYRVVLKLLESTTEVKRKSLENKVYSAHCFLACEYYKARRFQEAVWEFEKAMRIKANMPQLFYNLALSYAKLNACRTGIQILNQLNRIKPGQFKTFELLGDLYLQLSDWDRAQALYARALELADNKAPLVAKLKKLEDKVQRPKSTGDAKKDEEREDKFSIQNCLQDLTLEAELGRLQPVYGREKDLQQALEILACQSKKNVLILGDPGVGKTALVLELAYRIAAGKVSPRLQDRRLLRVNMGALLAGAKFRGQFEERLLHLIREARKVNGILFFDDIHQIVAGGGGKAGTMEASHFIKPALLNDEIQIIGATSFEEFRNSVEKDTSFLRCFQTVKLEEPDNETLLRILQAYRSSLENYHHVMIHEESLETTLMWVKVLLRDRALPDKALDVLDRAAARISLQEQTAIVSSEAVLETISEISGVPLNRMSVSEKVHYRNIESFLSQRVVGQEGAIGTVSRVLCTSKLRMNLNPTRPKGIFLFVGPTGVGKTELAKAMAQFLFGHEDKIVRIDMSEYMERYSASRLIGTS